MLIWLMTVTTFPASAFWVVNFGTAGTLLPGKFGFAAGLGGQMVFVGDPRKANAFFMIPHAGFRYGITSRLDAGLRLAPLPLPYNTVGPGFGMNLDAKLRLTPADAKTSVSVVLGIGGAHVSILEDTRLAYSLNSALLVSRTLDERNALTLMARQVNLGIPTAEAGSAANNVNIYGASLGWKHTLMPNINILPEVGVYSYQGKIRDVSYTGPGFQYGIMIATTI